MMAKSTENDTVSKLAALYEHGDMLLSADPAELIQLAIAEITRLRASERSPELQTTEYQRLHLDDTMPRNATDAHRRFVIDLTRDVDVLRNEVSRRNEDAAKWRSLADVITRRESPCDSPDDVIALLDVLTKSMVTTRLLRQAAAVGPSIDPQVEEVAEAVRNAATVQVWEIACRLAESGTPLNAYRYNVTVEKLPPEGSKR